MQDSNEYDTYKNEQKLDYLYKDLTEIIIKAFYKVYNTLGYGFLEKVYENAMYIELMSTGVNIEQQKPITVYYENNVVGNYFADMVANDKVIIEFKAKEEFSDSDECQLINYLKATEYEVGLLLNFGKKPGIKRKIYSNIRKIFKHMV